MRPRRWRKTRRLRLTPDRIRRWSSSRTGITSGWCSRRWSASQRRAQSTCSACSSNCGRWVSKALSLAINRQAICDTVYEGTRKPANSFLPPGVPGYKDNQWPESNYDATKAADFLAKAGFPGGKGLDPIKINFNSGAGHGKVVELVQSDLAKIGIKTTTEQLEFPQHIKKLTSGDYQMGRYGWIADYPIADNFTYALFSSKSADNASKYSNPEVDAAMLKARATIDDTARAAAWADIQTTIGSSMPVVPIVYYAHRHVGSNRVNDLVYDNQGLPHLEKAWLTGGGAAK